MADKPEINWDALKEQYVRGGRVASLGAVARAHGVSFSTLRRRAAIGGWADMKRRFGAEVREHIEKHQQEKINSALEQASETTALTLIEQNEALAEKLYRLADTSLSNAQTSPNHNERRASTITAAIAIDKWRLVTGQSSDKPNRDEKKNEDQWLWLKEGLACAGITPKPRDD